MHNIKQIGGQSGHPKENFPLLVSCPHTDGLDYWYVIFNLIYHEAYPHALPGPIDKSGSLSIGQDPCKDADNWCT